MGMEQPAPSTNEEYLWEIEDDLMEVRSGGKSGGGKRGKKTTNAIAHENKENAEKNRKEEVKLALAKELEQSPIKKLNKEQIPEAIEYYSKWVVKSVRQGYPHISDLDKDIDYVQTRSSGPGGQNVNKTSTAVVAKHLLTGIYARSESRDMLENKKDSRQKVLDRLEKHISNWKTLLKNIAEEEMTGEIIDFVSNLMEAGE